jgi:PAZ domain
VKEAVAKELVHRGVMTRYNQRIYRVEDIDYDMNPMKTFTLNEKGAT